MHRFFVTPAQIEGERIALSPEQARQVARVLRLQAGARVCILDGAGRECIAVLEEVSPRHAVARGEGWRAAEENAGARVTLGLGILKGERMDWAIQKATEVGAAEIVPVECARSVVRVERDRAAGKVERWQRIAREAAEQCHRGRMPEVCRPMPLAALLRRASEFDRVLLADEGTSASLAAALDPRPASVLLLVGPEGSFAPEEAEAARAAGALPVSLGPRILRAETAAIVGIALVHHHLTPR